MPLDLAFLPDKPKQNRAKPSLRPQIESTIDEVVDTFWEGDEDFKTLLKETAAHEAHFGEMDSTNVMRVDPIQRTEMKKLKYQPALAHLGAKRNEEGGFEDDLRTNIILGAMRYVTHPRWEGSPKGASERYSVWKNIYNTKAGKGTPEAWETSLGKFDMLPKEKPKPQTFDFRNLNPFYVGEAEAAETGINLDLLPDKPKPVSGLNLDLLPDKPKPRDIGAKTKLAFQIGKDVIPDLIKLGQQPPETSLTEYTRAKWRRGQIPLMQGSYGREAMWGRMSDEDALKGAEAAVTRQEKTVGDIQEATWLTPARKIIGESAQLLPFMLGATREGLTSAAILGGGFAGIALVAGQAGPQIATPEEIVTVPGAFAAGVTTGMPFGIIKYSMDIEGGNLYLDLTKQGVSEEVKRPIALASGLLIGLVEVSQLRILGAPFKMAFSKMLKSEAGKGVLRQVVLQYAKTVGAEIGEEEVQQVIQLAGRTLAGHLDEKPDVIPTKKEWVKELIETAKQAGPGMLGLALPGAGVQLMTDISAGRRPGDIVMDEETGKPLEITPEAPKPPKPAPEVAKPVKAPPAKPEKPIVEGIAKKMPYEMTREEFKNIPIIKYMESSLKGMTVKERNQLGEQLVDKGLMSIEDFNAMTKQFGFAGKVTPISDIKGKPIPSKPIEGDIGRLVEYIGEWQQFTNIPLFAHREVIIKALVEGKTVPKEVIDEYTGWGWITKDGTTRFADRPVTLKDAVESYGVKKQR